MANDEKLAEVLNIVRETREMTIETRAMVIETKAMAIETRDMVVQERALNNARFTQLATGLMDVKKEMGGMKVDLNAKIDKVYGSLSQDIQIFAQDLHHLKRRVTKLEKNLIS